MGRARGPGGGRRPKPTALKVLAGNAGHRPLNKGEPRPRPLLPKCPPVLQGEAKAEWRRMGKKLHALGLLSEIDGAALTTYCLTWARLVDAEGKLRQHGAVVISPNGFPVQSPYLAVATKATEQLVRILVEFGMTPSSRSRIQLPTQPAAGTPDSASEYERFFGAAGEA
ncbi:MAG: phage terminase small subunit P27 family [Planctomycetes bacterium]|nr:phage terminase small subunit P27 family [Planctomycetota bacterium]